MSKLKFISLIFFAFLFGLFFTQPASAATVTLSGHISDNLNNAIVGASIDVIDINTNTTVAGTTSDGSGNYTTIINGGTYNVQVTPPSGNNFSPAIAVSQNISFDKVLNFVLVPIGAYTLTGHIYDAQSNPVPNQTVRLGEQNWPDQGPTVTTDASGYYSFQSVEANKYYTLVIFATNNVSSLHVPQAYRLEVRNYSINQSTILDMTIPAKKVDVHVQNAQSDPVFNVAVVVEGIGDNSTIVSLGSINAVPVRSSYGYGYGVSAPITDSSGNTPSLWLIQSGAVYHLVASPLSGSPYISTTLSNIQITTDGQLLTVTMKQPLTLTGHIYDAQGNPVPNQTIRLGEQYYPDVGPSVTTDASGYYSFQSVEADKKYTLVITALNNVSSLQVSQRYRFEIRSYSINQSTILDMTIPARRVDVHVQNAQSEPVPNVSVAVEGTGDNSAIVSLGSINAVAVLSSYGHVSGVPAPVTNGSGDTQSLWLTQTGPKYQLAATPPSGSPYVSTTLSNIQITTDGQLLTVTMKQPVSLNGHIYDAQGNPVPNQTVRLGEQNWPDQGPTVTTDTSGYYSFQSVEANKYYTLVIFATNNVSSLHVPQAYRLEVRNYSINQSTILDMTIPAKKVDVHVQNAQSDPVPNVAVAVQGTGDNSTIVSLGSINAVSIQSSYGYGSPVPVTDSSGDTQSLWLTQTGPLYSFTATPPNGSAYTPFTLQNVSVSADQTELISLQYNHAAPVTTASLETQHEDGTYGNPTTVTLLATAASGYTIANTYYKIDNGSQQIYSTPFNVSGLGEHIVEYWSVDSSGIPENHKTKTFAIYVNQAPHVDPISDASINAGGTYTQSGSFADTDSTSWTATVDYGDGAGPESLTLNPDKTFSLSRQYTTAGTYTVTVVVTDDQGATGTTLASVTVNSPPKITGLSDAEINFQDDFFESGSFTDTDSASWSATVDYGFGGGSQTLILNPDKTFTLDYPYAAVGAYTVTVKVTDNQGATGTTSLTVTVNAPPHIIQLLGDTINEGQTYTEEGSFADSDSTSWTATVDYGDGTGEHTFASPNENIDQVNNTFTISHVYKDNQTNDAPYIVTVKITDNQGATSSPKTAQVSVHNVPPMVGTITIATPTVQINNLITASANFTDPGVLDTHTASWNWGDGTSPTPGIVTELNGSGSVGTDSHTYTTAGVYTVTLIVADKDGGADTRTTTSYVVVYDPTGGFITGSGHLESPIGAYPTNSEASGEVKFGINAKYKNSTPEGKTKFNFKEANFNFESTSYQWYVIIGNKAQLKGTGVINGSGNYNFFLTAIDTGEPEGERTDTLRMKITDTNGSIIYDNQPGTPDTADPIAPLQNGSIKIHY